MRLQGVFISVLSHSGVTCQVEQGQSNRVWMTDDQLAVWMDVTSNGTQVFVDLFIALVGEDTVC